MNQPIRSRKQEHRGAPTQIVKWGGTQMRIEMSRSLILFIWTPGRYREEVVRLFQGINRHSVRLLRARRFLGFWFVAVRRVEADAVTS